MPRVCLAGCGGCSINDTALLHLVDRYGRTVAFCKLASTNLERWMVGPGHALDWPTVELLLILLVSQPSDLAFNIRLLDRRGRGHAEETRN